MTYEGGYYGTDGIVHTGIGPFRLESGSYMAYGRASYNKGALRISAFGNFLDAEAPNLIAINPDTLGPVVLAFKTQTYDFEIGNTNVLGGSHIFTYGGNVRQNNFDISLAQGDDRTELGAYLTWEYFTSKFRFSAGARVDKFGNIDDPVFSPRVSIMFKPTPSHSIRASYNRAFVSPSFINNYLNQNISNTDPVIDLRPKWPSATWRKDRWVSFFSFTTIPPFSVATASISRIYSSKKSFAAAALDGLCCFTSRGWRARAIAAASSGRCSIGINRPSISTRSSAPFR